MTEKDRLPSRYHGKLNYEGKSRAADLSTLGFYLRGKPDAPGWRDIFAENEAVPIEYKGRIFPEWAVLDARRLIQEDPGAIEEVLKLYGLSHEDVPPLQ